MKPPYFLTAYEIAVKHGFSGTEEEWLNSLTAFYLAQQAGYPGTVDEWINDLNNPIPALEIGEVVTLEGGSNATASITGDRRNPVLNLGIPRGIGMVDALPLVGGRMKGAIDMNGNPINNLPVPTGAGQAVPRNYVDERLKKDGSEPMTGALDMDGHAINNLPIPTEGSQAVPKNYADESLKKDGSEPMTGSLNMGGKKITDIADPENDRDATNKKYVVDLVTSKHLIRTVVLTAAGWSESAPFTQTVQLEGIQKEDTPHWGLVRTGEAAAKMAQKEAYALVDELETADGSVTFTCDEERPELDLTIQLEVNR